MNGIRITILLVGSTALLASCAKTQINRTQAPAPQPLEQAVSQRITNLRANVQSLQHAVWRMPADESVRNQKLAAQALGDIAGALSAIEGPQPPGGFRQQLQIIQTSRAQLESLGSGIPPEPTVDTALRATYNALTSLRDSRFAADRHIARSVNEIGRRLPKLDATQGALHWVAVSDVLHPVARTLAVMAEVVEHDAVPQTRPAAGS